MPTETNVWTERFPIRSYEVDPRGRATLTTLCNLLQEAAANHAHALGVSVEQLQDPPMTWVLARLHVEIERYPAWRAAVRVVTWPSGERGLYATREFLLLDEDDALLGRATSAWMLVDLARRRPIRMPAFVQALRVPERARPLGEHDARLSAPARVDHEATYEVCYGDLDLNQHVNNVRYVAWALDALPREVLEGSLPVAAEVTFRAEATFGDVVRVQAGPPDAPKEAAPSLADRSFAHVVRRAKDDRELAVLHTRWRRLDA